MDIMNAWKMDLSHIDKLHNLLKNMRATIDKNPDFYRNSPLVGLYYYTLAYFYRY